MSARQVPIETPRPLRCDGCTREASPEHLRRRIARLEWASRYRPIHIATLILDPAPAAGMEDYFYAPEASPGEACAKAFYEDLLAACGIESAAGEGKERALAEFQRGGYFLADAVECPTIEGEEVEFDALVAQLAPTIVRRVRYSYRPKSVLVLSSRLAAVAQALREAGIDAELLPQDGEPVPIPDAGDAQARQRFREDVKALLARRG